MPQTTSTGEDKDAVATEMMGDVDYHPEDLDMADASPVTKFTGGRGNEQGVECDMRGPSGTGGSHGSHQTFVMADDHLSFELDDIYGATDTECEGTETLHAKGTSVMSAEHAMVEDTPSAIGIDSSWAGTPMPVQRNSSPLSAANPASQGDQFETVVSPSQHSVSSNLYASTSSQEQPAGLLSQGAVPVSPIPGQDFGGEGDTSDEGPLDSGPIICQHDTQQNNVPIIQQPQTTPPPPPPSSSSLSSSPPSPPPPPSSPPPPVQAPTTVNLLPQQPQPLFSYSTSYLADLRAYITGETLIEYLKHIELSEMADEVAELVRGEDRRLTQGELARRAQLAPLDAFWDSGVEQLLSAWFDICIAGEIRDLDGIARSEEEIGEDREAFMEEVVRMYMVKHPADC